MYIHVATADRKRVFSVRRGGRALGLASRVAFAVAPRFEYGRIIADDDPASLGGQGRGNNWVLRAGYHF